MRGSIEGERLEDKNMGVGVDGRGAGRRSDQWQHRGERRMFAQKKWATIAHIHKIIEGKL